ncbi:MAG: hypothetical protein M9916_04310 [Crocinitomicaceae bacterium]|nr:hypothetical protein [Crocinitomicaceae bacterium]
MKRLFYFAVAAAFATTMVTSCGKTTKGKMDGAWKIDTAEFTNTQISGNNTDSDKTAINGAVITVTETSGSSSNTESGVVNEATWTIKKDGTWERTITTTFTSGSNSYKTTEFNSGKWDFMKSVSKDYKNNERVSFGVLNSKRTYVNSYGSTTNTSTYSDTYIDGEVTEVYVVAESKKGALTLTQEGNNVYSSTSGSTTNTTTYKSNGKYTMSK